MVTTADLKRRVALVRSGKRRARLPDDLKRALVAHVRARRERGDAWSAIEAEVGVGAKVLHVWLRAASAKTSTAIIVRPRLSAVRVVPDADRGRVDGHRQLIVVRGARGVSVEGLSVRDVAVLLRELSL
jgi:transposase-like protein